MNSLVAALLIVDLPRGSAAYSVQQEREADHHPAGSRPRSYLFPFDRLCGTQSISQLSASVAPPLDQAVT